MKTNILFAAGLAALAHVGCAAVEPQQRPATALLPDPGPSQEYTVQWPDQGRGLDRYIRLTLDTDITDACRLAKPHFQFDSDEPLPQDQFMLKALAECLNQPVVQKLSIRLVGRADPRGNTAYNTELGQRRAERVKEILIANGVAAERLVTGSRGDKEAMGDKGLYSYGYDRRVDIVLVGLVRRPR